MATPPATAHPGKQPRFRVRAASLQDYPQIAALEARYGLGIKTFEEWRHLWVNNPVYRELQPDWPIGWVLEDDDKQIVASMGNIPLLYEFEGKRVLAASGRSWVADVAYRSPALLLLDYVVNQSHVDLYLNNTASQNSLAPLNALECSRVPVGVWDEIAYWVTNYRGFYRSVVAMKNYRLTRPFGLPETANRPWTRMAALRCRLAKPLSYPLAAAAFLRDRLATTSLREGDVEVQPCSGFDDRFDMFWETLRRNNPHTLLALHTRDVLEWHFKHQLLANRLWIETVVDGSRLAAYAIFDKTLNSKSGFTHVRLVDYQSADHSTHLLAPLLSWALRKCRSEGVHLLEHTGRWLERGELLDTAVPYRLPTSTWSYFYRANSPQLKEALKDRQVWAPSLFDGDATL
ncbi:MAG TPA: hypothetical protein VNH18_34580 [Bryobacteraceae bacterium]|nr:hypothetical protein [Bryobacteraceae bacterium]